MWIGERHSGGRKNDFPAGPFRFQANGEDSTLVSRPHWIWLIVVLDDPFPFCAGECQPETGEMTVVPYLTQIRRDLKAGVDEPLRQLNTFRPYQ